MAGHDAQLLKSIKNCIDKKSYYIFELVMSIFITFKSTTFHLSGKSHNFLSIIQGRDQFLNESEVKTVAK